MKKIFPLLIAVILVLSGCNSNEKENAAKEASNNNQPSKPVFIMAGKVESSEKADVSSKIPAKVAEVLVDVGSTVKKGDIIIKLDTKDIEAQVAQAEAALNTAQANLNKAVNGARSEQISLAKASYDNAKNSYDRIKSLFDQGGASKQQLENAELALTNARQQLSMLDKASPDDIKVLESQVKQYQAAVDLARTQLNNGTLVSPVNGIVSAKNINVGELAPAGTILVSIVNSGGILVNAYLPAALINKVKAGQEVIVKVSEAPEKLFQGEITAIDPAVDAKGKNILVKVKIKDSDSELKPGMFAEIGIKN